MAWEIEFFKKDNGHCPTEEFLDDPKHKKVRPYILNAMEQLEEHGYNLQRPQAAPLGDGIYELRVRWIKIQYRFLYFFDGKNIIVVTHGFIKSDNAVSENEIKRAKGYRAIYFLRKSRP
jgi:phage-related protein